MKMHERLAKCTTLWPCWAPRFVFDGDNPVVWLERSLDHWLQEVSATDVVLYERWMNNEIMAGAS